MVDFVKIQVKDSVTVSELYSNTKLIWYNCSDQLSHFDFETINSKKTRIYKGILFCFRENYLDILFRPHYYFNDNLHNANDFNMIDCMSVFKEFINDFDILNYDNYRIVNIEFGVNFRMDKYGKDLISFLEYHKKDQFRTDMELAYSKKSYSVNRNGIANKHKIIKAYCKGLQFSEYCDINTLRLEIKSKRSKYINTCEIFNIGDLLNFEVYNKMSVELISTVDKLLILDNITSFDNLNTRNTLKLKEYLNNYTWYDALQKERTVFNQKRKRYFNLLDKTGYNVHAELKNIIKNKLQELIISKNETSTYSAPNNSNETSTYSSVYKGGICCYPNIKKCLITGLDISMQKDSFLISHTGLKYYFKNDKKEFEKIKYKYYFKNDKKEFEKIKYKYLSKKWINSDFETQIKELAHNIRNKSNNLKISRELKYNPNQIQIF